MMFSLKPGPLITVSCLLFFSAVIRVGLHGDVALASVSTGAVEPDKTCEIAPDLSAALDAVKQRQNELSQKEQKLASLEQALEQSKTELSLQLQELINAEAELSKTLTTAKTAAQSDLAQLADVYTAMKPKQAAAVFEEMDPDFASGFLSLMPAETAANILAGMTPTKAYALSAILAGRNANVPTE